MAPKLLPGGLWAALGRRLWLQRLPGALLEGLWGGPGVPKKSLLAPWGPPGAKSWSISGFRGVPGRPPERPGPLREAILEAFLQERLAARKKSEILKDFQYCGHCFLFFVSISSSSWRRRRESAP